MNNKKLLIIFDDNWADEFDIYGFKVIDEDEWKKIKNSISEYFKIYNEYEYCFGTNESNVYTSEKQFLACFKVYPLFADDVNLLERTFGKYEKGQFPHLDNFQDRLDNPDDYI